MLLTSPPILQYPDFTRQFILTTDASNECVGAVLSQGEPSKDLPIAFASRVMSKAEKNYSVSEKELLAITWAVKHYRPYLFGKRFLIYSDHKPLKYLMSVKDPSSRLLRFRLKLDEYDYTIEYKPGRINTNADALSRAFPITTRSARNVPSNTSPVASTSAQAYLDESQNQENSSLQSQSNYDSFQTAIDYDDPTYQLSEESYSSHEQPLNLSRNQEQNNFNNRSNTENVSEEITPEEQQSYDSARNSDGTVPTEPDDFSQFDWSTVRESFTGNEKMTPSPAEILTILAECHDTPTGGHQGIIRTFKRIKRRYNWPGMLGDVRKYVRKCPKCQIAKPSALGQIPLQVTTTSKYVIEKILMDVVGPLPLTTRNNKYILTIQDDLSKFLVTIPLVCQDSVTIASALAKHFICIFGVPKIILTNRDSNFISNTIKKLCKLFNIKKINSTAYRPQTQGIIERSHRTLKEYLRSFVNKKQTDWDLLLPYSTFCFNTATSCSTNFTPFELVFGQVCRLPTSIESAALETVDATRPIEVIENELRQINKIARENQISQKIERKIKFDVTTRDRTFEIGDKVLLKK